MLGIELDFVKKLEVGFCVAVLGVAGYFFVSAFRAQPDPNVTAWVEEHKVPVNAKLPISASNPVDLKRSNIVSVFANHDGQLSITEYPGETGFKPSFAFKPDRRRETFNSFQSQWQRVEKISDPARRTITMAAYVAVEGRPMGLMYRADLDKDQKLKAKEIYETMTNQVFLVDEDVKQGLVDPEAQGKVLAALEAYRGTEGDVRKDRPKQLAAAKVFDVGMAYFQKLQDKKNEAIEKYVADTYALLNDEQRKKLADAGQELASRTPFRRPAKAAG